MAIPALNSWMGALPNNINLSRLSIPGTHDSCSVHDGGLFGFVHTQTETIEWQLNNGIRYLDIRCANRALIAPFAPGMFYIYHGIIYQGLLFDDVLNTCFTFLSKNPRETIIMRVQQEHSSDSELYKRIFTSYLEEFGRNKFYLGDTVPSLGAVRGKIVLITGTPYIDEGLWYSDAAVQDEYSNPQVADKENKIVDHINASIQSTEDKLYINHLSATGAGHSLWTPWSYAQVMNPFTLGKIQNDFRNSTQLGIIAYDYAGASTPHWNAHDNLLAKAIIARNNFPASLLESGFASRNLSRVH